MLHLLFLLVLARSDTPFSFTIYFFLVMGEGGYRQQVSSQPRLQCAVLSEGALGKWKWKYFA